MDRSSDDGAAGSPSRAETARSAVEDSGPTPSKPDDPRERFWAFLCQFAVYFYLLAYLVTVLAVLTLLALGLWYRARGDLANPEGQLALLLTSLGLFGATGAGIWVLLRQCNKL